MSPTEFLLLLHLIPHVGEKTLARLLRLASQQRLTPDVFLGMTSVELQSRFDLRPDSTAALETQREALLLKSSELVRTLRAHGIHLLSVESATYPARLIRNDDAPPPLVYALGALGLLDWSYAATPYTFTIAVSNGASSQVVDRLDILATEMSAAGAIPVTGHDRAPYQRLALSAQRHNRPSIYVLDRGLREALGPQLDRPPFAAARIRDAAFDTARDLALSPFRMDDHSIGANNRRRDSLIFALSDVVIALDVRVGGAMYDDCLRARSQGRAVFVADGGREGNAALLAQGCASLPTGRAWLSDLRRAQRN